MTHKIALPDWARTRGRTLNHFPMFEPARTAALIIDMQRAFVGRWPMKSELPLDYGDLANPHAYDIVPNINCMTSALRSAGTRIYWCRHTVVTDGPGKLPQWRLAPGAPMLNRALTCGAPTHALHDELEVVGSDQVFDKYRFSAFQNASLDLDRTLRDAGIETVIIAGTLTNCCCECTARDANLRDYQVLFVSDATASFTDQEHNAALLNITLTVADVVSTDDVLRRLHDSRRLDGVDLSQSAGSALS